MDGRNILNITKMMFYTECLQSGIPQSKKKSTSHYKNGIENGFRKNWDEDGKLTFQGNFVNGVEEIK